MNLGRVVEHCTERVSGKLSDLLETFFRRFAAYKLETGIRKMLHIKLESELTCLKKV
jgi:hypothetical protein